MITLSHESNRIKLENFLLNNNIIETEKIDWAILIYNNLSPELILFLQEKNLLYEFVGNTLLYLVDKHSLYTTPNWPKHIDLANYFQFKNGPFPITATNLFNFWYSLSLEYKIFLIKH